MTSLRATIRSASPSVLVFALALALGAGRAYAQSSDASLADPNSGETSPVSESERKAFYRDWFSIEMIVFERAADPAQDEKWSKNLFLYYPRPRAFLQTVDEYLAGSPQASDDGRAPIEIPFIKLDASQFKLQAIADNLQRQRGYRVLFHQSWHQPLKDTGEEDNLVIEGGDVFGEHHELEGSITIGLSRYIHLSTNLWLTHFETNYGQESEHWPALPPVPKPIDAQSAQQDDNPDSSANTDTGAADPALQQNPDKSDWDRAFDDEFSLGDQFTNFSNIESSPYLIKQIVLMQQKRRMRSGELHYIDHPQLGILIRVDKYPDEDSQ